MEKPMNRCVAAVGGLIVAVLIFLLNAGRTSDFVLLQMASALVFVALDLNRLLEKQLDAAPYLIAQLIVGYYMICASTALRYVDLPFTLAFIGSSITALNLMAYLVIQWLSLLMVTKSDRLCLRLP
jgi:hypothetical protein